MSTVQTCVRSTLALIVLIAAAAAFVPATAAAADGTTWICKPGQADDLCAGTIDGESIPAPGEEAAPLGYTRPADPPVDCFYLYPTQSDQPGPNSDLAKDPPIRRVVVQQARMFSSVCDVYAPMYRQVTNNGSQASHNASVETAYQSAKSGFKDYLKNYNDGRGFIMLGHSQGSAHTARLIQELVDTNPKLRKRFVGAIAPGANIAVPIGESVGGLFQHVPACTEVGEYGCVIAFSTYDDVPGPNAAFSRLDFGYWIYPQERFDSAKYEAMCTDPARLDGGDGTLLPLVNFDYLFDVPKNGETAAPWKSQPDYYKVKCKRQDGSHWLNLAKVGLPGDNRVDLGKTVANGSNYHVPEVNLAEGNLLTITQLQSDSYEKEQARIAKLQKQLQKLTKKSAKVKKQRASLQKKAKKLKQKVAKANSAKSKKAAKKKLKQTRRKAKATKKRAKLLKGKIAAIERQLG